MDAIDLWTQRLEGGPEQLARWWSLLSADERARADRFVFEVHRHRYVIGRGRLRDILSPYLECLPGAIAFEYNSFGKPALAGRELLFNVSHSGAMAVYAVARGREVGIDIEEIREDFREDRIPEMFFAPGEVAALRGLPASEQTLGFLQCWTRKEAYVKARAEGLSIPLDSFEVTLRPGEPAHFVRGTEGWSVESFRLGDEYVGAVVAAGGPIEMRWF